jgi:hypothetical protein
MYNSRWYLGACFSGSDVAGPRQLLLWCFMGIQEVKWLYGEK